MWACGAGTARGRGAIKDRLRKTRASVGEILLPLDLSIGGCSAEIEDCRRAARAEQAEGGEQLSLVSREPHVSGADDSRVSYLSACPPVQLGYPAVLAPGAREHACTPARPCTGAAITADLHVQLRTLHVFPVQQTLFLPRSRRFPPNHSHTFLWSSPDPDLGSP